MIDHISVPSAGNNRYLLGSGTFRFACHSGVSCFTRCCHDADLYIYPYDIIRLKQCLGMSSEEFLLQHTITAIRDIPYFPNVMLKMSDREGHPCPFLSQEGCTVYEDRPYSCRAYPLEPVMYGDGDSKTDMHFYVARHSHCRGHRENRSWTAQQWMADQQMEAYNNMNAHWARIASRFCSNPFGPAGIDSPAMKMAFMASYNVDTFRRFVFASTFLSRFDVQEERLQDAWESETALLLLGFDWIRRFLFREGPLGQKDSNDV
jgi:Fe-S-cluster containining protein